MSAQLGENEARRSQVGLVKRRQSGRTHKASIHSKSVFAPLMASLLRMSAYRDNAASPTRLQLQTTRKLPPCLRVPNSRVHRDEHNKGWTGPE